jgi:hypothetical protein
MNIHASSTRDYETVKALVRAHSYRILPPVIRLVVFLLVLTPVAALSIYGYIYSRDMLFLICLVMSLFAVGMNLFIYFGLPRMTYNSSKKLQGLKSEFIFNDSSFTEISEKDGFSSEETIPYEHIIKVDETKGYLFLYIAKNQAYCVEKATMTQKDYITLQNRLIGIFGKKYRYKNI